MLAHLQRPIGDRAESHALQPDDRVADGLAHVAHLAGAPLVQRDRHQRLVLARAEPGVDEADDGGRRPPAPECHPAAQPLEGALVGHAAYAGVVLALDLVTRVQQARGEVAVVGEQQQALGVVVEAAYRIDVLVHVRQQVQDRGPLLGVLPRRHVAARLVEEDVAVARGDAHALAVDANVVSGRVGPRAQLAHRLAVHRHPALQDQRFGGAPGCHTGGGEDLLEAVTGEMLAHRGSKNTEDRGQKTESRIKKPEGVSPARTPNPEPRVPAMFTS